MVSAVETTKPVYDYCG